MKPVTLIPLIILFLLLAAIYGLLGAAATRNETLGEILGWTIAVLTLAVPILMWRRHSAQTTASGSLSHPAPRSRTVPERPQFRPPVSSAQFADSRRVPGDLGSAERQQGLMRIPTGAIGLVVLVLVVSAGVAGFAAFRLGSGTGQAHDVVVSVLLRCTLPSTNAKGEVSGSGGKCRDTTIQWFDVHKEVTVRTPKGTAYVVNIAPTTVVNVGDNWPR